jgi:hypothetical protein
MGHFFDLSQVYVAYEGATHLRYAIEAAAETENS